MQTENSELKKKTIKTLKGKRAAIYLAMKAVDSDMAYDVMKKIMAEKSDEKGQKIAKCCGIPGLKFSRTKTIGAGDDLCDFKMELM